ncbi:MAG: SusC/RagA family TonB-linked outer membrane protein [Chitinophagaceae bacterium]|nr:MAG: SusC/RagA family TonB-linked outer membrane protein [Chitinophagaceae bacterium]
MLLPPKWCRPQLRQMILLLFFFPVPELVDAQIFSISVRQASLAKVFDLIEQQGNVHFIYSEEVLAEGKPVTVSVAAVSLDSLLGEVMKNQPLGFRTEGNKIIIHKKKTDPPGGRGKILEGRVVNEHGLPLPGITITILQTGQALSTGLNGEFRFPAVPVNAVIIVSGAEIQTKEIESGAQPYLLISARSRIGLLDETIIIAYGKTTRRTSTATVQKVSKAELERQPVDNVLAGMQGRVTGLQVTQTSGLPGSNFTVRLRGQNSIGNGNEPLYIIDGVPFPSTTLTSSFGGGGGANSSPLANVNPSDIESVEVLKDADATAIYGSRGANGVILITTKRARAGKTAVDARFFTGWGRITRQLPMLGLKDYLMMRREAFRNDGVTPTASNARDLLSWDTTRSTDWQDLLIGNTMNLRDVNVGVSGGSDQTQFSISAGYHDESTIIPGPFNEKKVSLGFQLNHASNDRRFQIGLSGSYLQNHNLLPRDNMTAYLYLSPNAPEIYNADGSFNWENSSWVNPFAILRQHYATRSDNLLSNLHLSYRVFQGLEAKLNLGFSSLNLNEHVTVPARSQNPANFVFTEAGFGNTSVETFIAEPQISYRWKMQSMSFEVLTGSTMQGTDRRTLIQSGSMYQSDELMNSLQGAASVMTTTDMTSRYRYAGVFARIAADYSGRYFLTLNARRDGSSRYGPENRFANFGSAGAAWIFSREKWLAKNRLLSFGKLKASLGTTGNDQIGDYRFLDSYSTYPYTYQGVATLNPTQLYNPSFRWEKVTKTEASLEIGLMKDRVLIAVNYFNNFTGNQLVQYSLPAIAGFQGVLANLPARVRNYGWELDINATILQRSRWTWSAHLTLTLPKNRLVKFDGLANSSYANSYVVGQPLSIVKRFATTGVDPATGNYNFVDADGDGRISAPGDLSQVIFTGQQYFGGLEQSIRYGQIQLSVFTQFVRNKNANTYINNFSRPGSLTNQPDFVLDRWQHPGDQGDIQKFSNSNTLSNPAFTNFRNSNGSLGDASFVRIKNIHLSYDIPTSYIRKVGIKAGDLFVQAQNLFTITPYKGLDPETRAVIPPLKIVTLGFHITI